MKTTNENEVRNEVEKVLDGISKGITETQYRKAYTEKQCEKWLNTLGNITQVIRLFKGMTNLLPQVDKLKTKINMEYDALLDVRLGKIR